MGLLDLLRGNPIIAAVREPQVLDYALRQDVGAIFMLCGEISDLRKYVARCEAASKPVFIHLELVSGLSSDQAGMKYLAGEVKPDGIITTKVHQVALAMKERLLAIQRLFMLDTLALRTGVSTAKAAKPDAVEVLPAVVPKAIATVAAELSCPVIAGGLIGSMEDIKAALAAGAVAVSLSKRELWGVQVPGWRRGMGAAGIKP
ncbi:MAG: glycerol-3-phosphate responsive antiterminator [Firmicutes bacterium]|nr:glycerol-3-phosphate responsive antiterminator [Bacillota bacterium]